MPSLLISFGEPDGSWNSSSITAGAIASKFLLRVRAAVRCSCRLFLAATLSIESPVSKSCITSLTISWAMAPRSLTSHKASISPLTSSTDFGCASTILLTFKTINPSSVSTTWLTSSTLYEKAVSTKSLLFSRAA